MTSVLNEPDELVFENSKERSGLDLIPLCFENTSSNHARCTKTNRVNLPHFIHVELSLAFTFSVDFQ